MELVLERKVVNGNKKKSKKIYINTLVPNFQFKNKAGKIIKSANCCITL